MRVRIRAALFVLSTALVAVSCGEDGGPTEPVVPITIETEGLAEAIEGQTYSQQLEASGGSGAHSWALAAGTLPSGLTLAPAGAITGTPNAPGTSTFRVRATDGAGQTATADLSIDVVQTLAVHTGSLADGVVGEAYSAELQAVGGRGTHTWTVTGGEAASWLAVSSDGALSGTPTASGATTVTVTVADESGQEATREIPVMVRDPLAVAETTLPEATQGRAYAAQLVATGGDGAYTWEVVSGSLPAGVELASGGALTGTPTAAGTFAFTAQVTDGADRVATRALSITVEAAPTIQTTSLPPGDLDEPYDAQLTATGGTGAYTWSIVEGDLPDGLAMSAAGAISGTPGTLGSATFTVEVADEAAETHTRELTIVVAEIQMLVSGVPVSDLADDAEGVRYYAVEVPAGASQLSVVVSGGTGDVDLYLRRGALPEMFAYDCRPLRDGNEETCTVPSPTAGSWYVMLRGHEAYTGVTLEAILDE